MIRAILSLRPVRSHYGHWAWTIKLGDGSTYEARSVIRLIRYSRGHWTAW